MRNQTCPESCRHRRPWALNLAWTTSGPDSNARPDPDEAFRSGASTSTQPPFPPPDAFNHRPRGPTAAALEWLISSHRTGSKSVGLCELLVDDPRGMPGNSKVCLAIHLRGQRRRRSSIQVRCSTMPPQCSRHRRADAGIMDPSGKTLCSSNAQPMARNISARFEWHGSRCRSGCRQHRDRRATVPVLPGTS